MGERVHRKQNAMPATTQNAESRHSFVICFLGSCKATLVYTIVDVVIDFFVDFIYGGAKFLWVVIMSGSLWEFMVKHSNYL